METLENLEVIESVNDGLITALIYRSDDMTLGTRLVIGGITVCDVFARRVEETANQGRIKVISHLLERPEFNFAQ